MTEDEKIERREFAMRESERCAREASQARAELGRSITARTLELPEKDEMQIFRARALERERGVVRARVARQMAERKQVEQAQAHSVAMVEQRIKQEIAALVEQRIGEEIVRVLQTINQAIIPALERTADRMDRMDKLTTAHEAKLATALAGLMATRRSDAAPVVMPPRPRPRRPVSTAVN